MNTIFPIASYYKQKISIVFSFLSARITEFWLYLSARFYAAKQEACHTVPNYARRCLTSSDAAIIVAWARGSTAANIDSIAPYYITGSKTTARYHMTNVQLSIHLWSMTGMEMRKKIASSWQAVKGMSVSSVAWLLRPPHPSTSEVLSLLLLNLDMRYY